MHFWKLQLTAQAQQTHEAHLGPCPHGDARGNPSKAHCKYLSTGDDAHYLELMVDSGRELLQAQLMLKDKSFMHPQETERWTKAFLQCACDPCIPGVSFKTGPRLQKRLRLIPGTPKKEVGKGSRRLQVQCSGRACGRAHSVGVRAPRSNFLPLLLNKSAPRTRARRKFASSRVAQESEPFSAGSRPDVCL